MSDEVVESLLSDSVATAIMTSNIVVRSVVHSQNLFLAQLQLAKPNSGTNPSGNAASSRVYCDQVDTVCVNEMKHEVKRAALATRLLIIQHSNKSPTVCVYRHLDKYNTVYVTEEKQNKTM